VIRHGQTSFGRITIIIGAAIAVVAHDLGAYTYSFVTVVGLSANIQVGALGPGKRLVHAAGVRVAQVLGAVVSVVARNIVHLAVAVIVHPVAHLLSCGQRVTL